MMQHAFFRDKKILLIDKAEKNTNDRTWCFWEQQPGPFEDIVYHRWPQIDFFSNRFSARFDLAPYTYKMIRGIDLYTTVLNKAEGFSNIDVVYDEVIGLSSADNSACIKTNAGEITAQYVFNSILAPGWMQEVRDRKAHLLLQHFTGWWIETAQDVFNSNSATFMDFRVSQQNGNAFMYILPVSKNKALVEYTVLSENILPPHQYDAAIEDYIGSILKIEAFRLLQKERGIIPMSSYEFPSGTNNIINIGTAGGQTKGSTGFTFQFIQKQTEKIITAMLNSEKPLTAKKWQEKRFRLYDDVLLYVLVNNKMPADILFPMLFENNPINNIFGFLNNESSFKQELKIMSSVPPAVFLPAAGKTILGLSSKK